MLTPRFTPGAKVTQTSTGWLLETPESEAGTYCLAQLDNYSGRTRRSFQSRVPTSFSLHCRASEALLPGTWGFGFWNDPFALSLAVRGTTLRLPVLPNACWFFHASAENHLSFKKTFPGSGFLVQTFRSPNIPSLLLAPAILGAPLLFSRTLSKLLRETVGKIISEDNLLLDIDVTHWHNYKIDWQTSQVTFSVDGLVVFETPISPKGPLGLVIWIDNQFARWAPDGSLSFGTLHQKSTSRLEIGQVKISR